MNRLTPAAIALLLTACASQISRPNDPMIFEAVPASFQTSRPKPKEEKKASLSERAVTERQVDEAIEIVRRYGGIDPEQPKDINSNRLFLVDKKIDGREYYDRFIQYTMTSFMGRRIESLIVAATFRENGTDRTMYITEGFHEAMGPDGIPIVITPKIDGKIDYLIMTPESITHPVYREAEATLTFSKEDIKHARSLYRETVSNLRKHIDWKFLKGNTRYPSDIKEIKELPNHGPHYICSEPERIWINGKPRKPLPNPAKRKKRDCIRLKRYSH